MTFTELQFKPHEIGHGHQAVVTFLNGETVSVVLGDIFYSNGVDTYEAWSSLDKEPIGYITEVEVTEILQRTEDH